MADKNQLSLANGAPPQMFSTNPSLSQTNFATQSQMQTRHPSGMENNVNTVQPLKPQASMVNGQVSPSIRAPNLSQQSNHINNFSNSGSSNLLHQQASVMPPTQQPLLSQPVKPNSTNSNARFPQNVQSVTAQQHPPVSMVGQSTSIPSSLAQAPPSYQSSKQNVNLNPSPFHQNMSSTSTMGIMHPAQMSSGGAAHGPLYQRQNPPISQYSSMPTVTGPSSSSQINRPLYGPPMTSATSKSSPYNKPAPGNYSFSSHMPSTSQGMSPSPQNQNVSQGSHSTPPTNKPSQFLNTSQSFPQSSTQFQPSQSSVPGIPQGYQPSPLASNQLPRPPPVSNAPPQPQPQPQPPPLYNYSNSQQGTPSYQNQMTVKRDIGPPQMGGTPSSRGMPPPPNSMMIRAQPSNSASAYNSVYGKYPGMNALTQGMERMSVTQQGFNKLWGIETVDLLQCRNILPSQKVKPPPIRLNQEFMEDLNCNSDIFCCTLNKIPETSSLLQKSRLPLGILIHPFRDLTQLAVIQCSSIVRCRSCRTYINPFVYFVDNKRWKCNLCFRVNELPDEFQYDPVSKTYGDPSRRPEIRSSTIEFIAPSEYMLRPPQPAIYLFVLDVSRWGCDSGYLQTLCSVLLEELDNIPGDSRTQIGFILFDSTIHFFSIAENYNQPHEMIVSDIDDVFLPTPDSLLVNLNENRQLIRDLLYEIPKKYAESFDTDSALGPALQAAYKLMSPTGGRITVFQSCLPNKGPGALGPREDPSQRSSNDVRNLGPQTDFYKRLSLDCSTQQISVDLFLVSSQYSDLATLAGISQFSGGCIYHFPLFRRVNLESDERLTRALRRYLTRKIGFEAVMRVRCSRGLTIHTFHGNFFVRSTDLLSLPNVNPDAGFGMQISIEENLLELQSVCFQAAVLYTSAKGKSINGERRIRVHTLCLPVSSNLSDILTSANQQAIIGLLGKMAVDRSLKSNLSDAREAFINVAIDILSAYKLVETSGGPNAILAPINLSLIPLYILALLKSTAFRTNQSTRLDDRVYAMTQMKTLPLRELIQLIHPDLYNVTHLDDQTGVDFEDKIVAQPPRLSLSSEHLDSRGAFLLDTPEVIYLLVGKNINPDFLTKIFDIKDIKELNKDVFDLPDLENEESEKLRLFISFLQSEKSWPAVTKIVTDPNSLTPFLIQDKAENALSYFELLNHVKSQLK